MRALLKRPSPFAFPGGLPGIDPAHPASRNLLFSGIPQGANFINLLSALRGTITGSPTANIDARLGPLFNTAANTDIASFTAPTTAFAQGTIAAIFTVKANTGSAAPQLICGDSNSGNVGLALSATDGVNQPDFRWGGTQFVLSGGPGQLQLFPFVPWFYAVTVSGAAGVAHWVVRRLDTGAMWTGTVSSLIAATSTGTGTFGIANRPASTVRQLNGGVAACMRSVTFLTKPQLLAWAGDPWSFWYPQQFDLLQAIAAAAAGGTAALAARAALRVTARALAAGAASLSARAMPEFAARGAITGAASLAGRSSIEVMARGSASLLAVLAARAAVQVKGRAQATGTAALAGATRIAFSGRLVPPGVIALVARAFARVTARAQPVASTNLTAATRLTASARASASMMAAIAAATRIRASARAAVAPAAALAARAAASVRARAAISAAAPLGALAGRARIRVVIRGAVTLFGQVFTLSPRVVMPSEPARLVQPSEAARLVQVSGEAREVDPPSDGRSVTPGSS